MSPFEAVLQSDPDGRETLVVRGELDLATAHHVVTQAKEWAGGLAPDPDEAPPIRLDLSGVTFLDSTGLGALIEARTVVTAAGRRLELNAVSPAVERVLSLAGLAGLFAEPSDGAV